MQDNMEIWEQGQEVEELLGRRPRWITRWGLLFFLLLAVLMLLGSWWIRYPDILVSSVVITAENPPAVMVARAEGKITAMYVSGGQEVKSGDLLLQIENPANTEEVLLLEKTLGTFRPDSAGIVSWATRLEERVWTLGEIMPYFAAFYQGMLEYRQFLSLKEYPSKITALKKKEKHTLEYIEKLKGQLRVLGKDQQLARKQFLRDSALFSQKVIAAGEYEKAESAWLMKRYEQEGAGVSLARTRIELSAIQKELVDLSVEYSRKKSEYLTQTDRQARELGNAIQQWKQKYLLITPVSGKVVFHKVWSINQQVTQGEKVLSIVPEGETKIYGRVSLPSGGAGKVRPGQEVNMKFADYPYLEYGMVRGKVASKSMVSLDELYTVEVELPGGLVTTYGRELEFQPGMSGQAEIITEELSLLSRLVHPVKHLITRNRRH